MIEVNNRFTIKQTVDGLVIYDIRQNEAFSENKDALKAPFFFTSNKYVTSKIYHLEPADWVGYCDDTTDDVLVSIGDVIEDGYQHHPNWHYVVAAGDRRNVVVVTTNIDTLEIDTVGLIGPIAHLLNLELPLVLIIVKGNVTPMEAEDVSVTDDVEVVEVVEEKVEDLVLDVSTRITDIVCGLTNTTYESDIYDIVTCKVVSDDDNGIEVTDESIIDEETLDRARVIITNPWCRQVIALYHCTAAERPSNDEIVSDIHSVFEYNPNLVDRIDIVNVDENDFDSFQIIGARDVYYLIDKDGVDLDVYEGDKHVQLTIMANEDGAYYSTDGGVTINDINNEVWLMVGKVHSYGDEEYLENECASSIYNPESNELTILVKHIDAYVAGHIINEISKYRDSDLIGSDLIVVVGIDNKSFLGYSLGPVYKEEESVKNGKASSNSWVVSLGSSEINFVTSEVELDVVSSSNQDYVVEDIFNLDYYQRDHGYEVKSKVEYLGDENSTESGMIALAKVGGTLPQDFPHTDWISVVLDASLDQPVVVYVAPAVSYENRIADLSKTFDPALVWELVPKEVWYENGLVIDGSNIVFILDSYANKAVLNTLTNYLGYVRNQSWDTYMTTFEEVNQVAEVEEETPPIVEGELNSALNVVSEEEFFSKEDADVSDTEELVDDPEPLKHDVDGDTSVIPETNPATNTLTLPLDDSMSILNLTGEVIYTELPLHSVDPKSITHEDFITLLRAFGGLGVIIDGRRSFKETVRKIDIVRAFNRHHIANLHIWILRDTGEDKYLEKIDSTPYND